MELVLRRRFFTARSTIGVLTVGERQWFTLEPPLEVDGQRNVACRACIPAGRYRIRLHQSARFGRLLPILLDVPGRSAILIHPLNRPEDTEGCIGVGCSRAPDWIGESRRAFGELFPLITASLGEREVWITITDEPTRSEAPEAPYERS